MIKAGELRHRVELQEDVGGEANNQGQATEQWVTRAEAWCSLRFASATESLAFEQQYGVSTQIMEMRYMPSVQLKTTWRVKFQDRLLYIAGIENVDHRNRVWRLFVTERV